LKKCKIWILYVSIFGSNFKANYGDPCDYHKSVEKIGNFYDPLNFFQKGYTPPHTHNFWPCACMLLEHFVYLANFPFLFSEVFPVSFFSLVEDLGEGLPVVVAESVLTRRLRVVVEVVDLSSSDLSSLDFPATSSIFLKRQQGIDFIILDANAGPGV